MTPASAGSKANTKKERLAQEIAKAVGAGRPVAVETVDFNDPNRPKTCLEVDFPILPINQISQIEGNAGKPIYQMSKWWARRRSSVFRAMLLAAAMKAPEDSAQAAKLVWDVYYANHQKKGALKNLKVADIFMGGGTTIVEGSRLGMQMYGCDLNPVAWFIVKNEIASVSAAEVQGLLGEIEAEVKPQIMPFYSCDCPRGHKGKWTHISTGEVMASEFDPLAVPSHERKEYRYEGPEIIYAFWAKHGPCQMTGCGHQTPIMSSPVVAVKTLTVKAWEGFECKSCEALFDVEASDARMALDAPLIVAETERPYTVLSGGSAVSCPKCGFTDLYPSLGAKSKNKKIQLALIVSPKWLEGSPGPCCTDADDSDEEASWLKDRGSDSPLIEIRGELPEMAPLPGSGICIEPRVGTVPKKSHFACGKCGAVQDVLKSIANSKRPGRMAPYAYQGYCPICAAHNVPYGGRFFSSTKIVTRFLAASKEFRERASSDLARWIPRTAIPAGLETTVRTPLHKYGYKTFDDLFNDRQKLLHGAIQSAIGRSTASRPSKEFVLGALQSFIRNNSLLAFWHVTKDHFAPALSQNNYQPKNTAVEVGAFCPVGYGPWNSAISVLPEALEWRERPYELFALDSIRGSDLKDDIGTKSIQIKTGDPTQAAVIECRSATDLSHLEKESFDLVITDPPFGSIMQYAELSDFFYVWLKPHLDHDYSCFEGPLTPKTQEAVDNSSRHPGDGDAFYKRSLTECWRSAHRILKPGGILTFTFHHDEDEPWIAVLESLFEASFYLEATFPIRADETKGEGAAPGIFGAQKVEYDIIHVCRKQYDAPQPISWARMRREVLKEVRQLTDLLELHQKAGLPAGDLKVIKRGKALEYYSRHYGKVFIDTDKVFTVRDALIGINQLIDEESGVGREQPPVNSEPLTRQFLRLFDGYEQLPRDQVQKLLRGTTIQPAEYAERGWCKEENKVYRLISPHQIAQEWHGKHRRRLTSDYDQAMVLIGASHPGSGISVTDTLSNENFRPHPALGRLLKWHTTHGATPAIRNAAAIAVQLYAAWETQHQDVVQQLKLFFDDGDAA